MEAALDQRLSPSYPEDGPFFGKLTDLVLTCLPGETGAASSPAQRQEINACLQLVKLIPRDKVWVAACQPIRYSIGGGEIGMPTRLLQSSRSLCPCLRRVGHRRQLQRQRRQHPRPEPDRSRPPAHHQGLGGCRLPHASDLPRRPPGHRPPRRPTRPRGRRIQVLPRRRTVERTFGRLEPSPLGGGPLGDAAAHPLS